MRALVTVLRFGRPLTARLLLAVAAGLAAAACSIGLASVSAWLISRAAEQPPVVALTVAITGVRAFGIGRGVLRYAERLVAHDAAFRVLGQLRAGVYARLARLAPAGLAELRTGDLQARLVSDVDGLADLWLRVLLPGASTGLAAAGAAVLIGVLLPSAGLVLALTVVVTIIGSPLVATAVARRAEQGLAPARGTLGAATLETLRGAPEIVAVGAAPHVLALLAEADDRLAAAERRSAFGAGVGNVVGTLAAGASVWLALILGIGGVRDGSLARVALAVVVLTPIAVHEVVTPTAVSARLLPSLSASARRVVDVLRRRDPVPEPAEPHPIPAGPLGLRAVGLRVRYPGSARDALGPFDLRLEPGAHLVVTGPSGAGKSTFAAACLRFLVPIGGRLEVVAADGTALNLDEAAGDDVRRAIGLCEQEPYVFDGTLGQNLLLARPGATSGELESVLETAGLLALMRSLPNGLDTPVGERGARLSAGQRQRLALARALLADVRILILDEPTEHLDERAARAFARDVAAAASDRTVLVLTHRPELFAPSDGWVAGPEIAATPG